jgi:hypothetical protein
VPPILLMDAMGNYCQMAESLIPDIKAHIEGLEEAGSPGKSSAYKMQYATPCTD